MGGVKKKKKKKKQVFKHHKVIVGGTLGYFRYMEFMNNIWVGVRWVGFNVQCEVLIYYGWSKCSMVGANYPCPRQAEIVPPL